MDRMTRTVLMLRHKLKSVLMNECIHGQNYVLNLCGSVPICAKYFSDSANGRDERESIFSSKKKGATAELEHGKSHTRAQHERNRTGAMNFFDEEPTTDLLELENRMRSGEQCSQIINKKRQHNERSLYNYGLPGLGKRPPSWVKKSKKIKATGEIVFGLFPVLLALQQGHRQSHKLYIKAEFQFSNNPVVRQIFELADEKEVPIHKTSASKLNELSQERPHQGVCLDASKMKYEPVKDLPRDETHDSPQLWLVLHSIQDPMNFGAVLRSSYYLGVDKVLAVKKNSCALSPVVSKASAGALELMRIHAILDLTEFIQKRQEAGWRVIGTVGHDHENAAPISDISLTQNTLLILGNEGAGIPDEILSSCNHLVTISPMKQPQAGLDSLNVSVATGILLHHLLSTKPR